MRAGRHNKLIRFERLLGRRNALGNEIRTDDNWSCVAECWARIEPLSGREFFAAQQVQSETSYQVTVRWQSELADLNAKDRIRYGSRIFDIRAVLNIEERSRELQIMCTENPSQES